MATDLEQLVDMGFDPEKSKIALTKGGNLTGAIDWLDKNADKSLEDLQEEANEESTSSVPEPGAEANSMVCNDCGKKFRNMTACEAHAEKTGHVNFEQSTDVIAPLTEEEKKAKLEELRAKLAAKRAGQSGEEKALAKRNDEIKKKHTKENEDAKEELQRKEQIKEAARKRQEKKDDIEAKKRIKDKIEADKAERRRKAEEENAMRANPAAFDPQGAGAAPAAAAAAAPVKQAVNHSEARLRLQTSAGNVMKNFPAETTLFEVAHALTTENGVQVESFTQNFPKKVFDTGDFGMTLKEAGLVPSAALIVK